MIQALLSIKIGIPAVRNHRYVTTGATSPISHSRRMLYFCRAECKMAASILDTNVLKAVIFLCKGNDTTFLASIALLLGNMHDSAEKWLADVEAGVSDMFCFHGHGETSGSLKIDVLTI
jgi:hypothetical protein